MKKQLALILASALTAFTAHLCAAGQRPNVVILYADDMGVADVSYGDKEVEIQTPNLDRLASDGMTFIDGHPEKVESMRSLLKRYLDGERCAPSSR